MLYLKILTLCYVLAVQATAFADQSIIDNAPATVLVCVKTGDESRRYQQVAKLVNEERAWMTVADIHSPRCSKASSSFWSKPFPGTKKSYSTLFSPLVPSLVFFGLGHNQALLQRPLAFLAAASANIGFSFVSTHSDYKVEDWARKHTSDEAASHVYSAVNVAYWTVAPSLYLFPIEGSKVFGPAMFAFFTNNLLIASINNLFNSFYAYEGLEHRADALMTSWYLAMNALLPPYHALTMYLLTNPALRKYFVAMNLSQVGLYLGLETIKQTLVRKHMFTVENASPEELAAYIKRRSKAGRSFERKTPKGSILKFSAPLVDPI